MNKNGRIEIFETKTEIENGRRKETKRSFWKCWAEIQALNSKERYEALQNGFESTLVFKVRSCNYAETIRLCVKKYTAVYKDVEFEIYEATPLYTDPGHYLLKCRAIG